MLVIEIMVSNGFCANGNNELWRYNYGDEREEGNRLIVAVIVSVKW